MWVDILVSYVNGGKIQYSNNFTSTKELVVNLNDYVQDFIDLGDLCQVRWHDLSRKTLKFFKVSTGFDQAVLATNNTWLSKQWGIWLFIVVFCFQAFTWCFNRPLWSNATVWRFHCPLKLFLLFDHHVLAHDLCWTEGTWRWGTQGNNKYEFIEWVGPLWLGISDSPRGLS